MTYNYTQYSLPPLQRTIVYSRPIRCRGRFVITDFVVAGLTVSPTVDTATWLLMRYSIKHEKPVLSCGYNNYQTNESASDGRGEAGYEAWHETHPALAQKASTTTMLQVCLY